MTLEIGFHPAAAAEVVSAAAWYENETVGLGDRFLDAVEATVLRGSRWPNVGKPVVIRPDGAVVNRKLPVGGFPWAKRLRGHRRDPACARSLPPASLAGLLARSHQRLNPA